MEEAAAAVTALAVWVVAMVEAALATMESCRLIEQEEVVEGVKELL